MSLELKIIALIALLAALGGIVFGIDHYGYSRGKLEAKAEWDAANKKAADTARADQTVRQTASNTIEAVTVKKQSEIETRFMTIDREVIRYVEKNATAGADVCALDSDGVRLWNAANLGAFDSDGAGIGNAGLPATAGAAVDGQPAGAGVQPRRRDEVLPPVRGAEPREGRVDQQGQPAGLSGAAAK